MRPVSVVLDLPNFDNDLDLSSVANFSMLTNLLRARLLNDSTNRFSQGEPGSMSAVRGAGQAAVVALCPGDHLWAVVHE